MIARFPLVRTSSFGLSLLSISTRSILDITFKLLNSLCPSVKCSTLGKLTLLLIGNLISLVDFLDVKKWHFFL